MVLNKWKDRRAHGPGKMLMSMMVRVRVWMLTMASTPNSAMPSSARSSFTKAAITSLLGGGSRGIFLSSYWEVSMRFNSEDIKAYNQRVGHSNQCAYQDSLNETLLWLPITS